jgi:hypothetical protein
MSSKKSEPVKIPQTPGFFLNKEGKVVYVYYTAVKGLVVGFQSDNEFSVTSPTVKDYGPYTPIYPNEYISQATANIRFMVLGLVEKVETLEKEKDARLHRLMP